MSPISRGFHRRHQEAEPAGRVPPGQYVTHDFPVLSAGPTPHTPLADWTFSIEGGQSPVSWTWQEFQALPHETVTVDIHCVTRWSKLDTDLDGRVAGRAARRGLLHRPLRAGLLRRRLHDEPAGGRPDRREGLGGLHLRRPALPAEHGGPARLLVPHLYFWKSAKWVRGLRLRETDAPGFWEMYGYHMYGDPWREQRYAGD